jgi:chemotaxis protein histidine kinase CheA
MEWDKKIAAGLMNDDEKKYDSAGKLIEKYNDDTKIVVFEQSEKILIVNDEFIKNMNLYIEGQKIKKINPPRRKTKNIHKIFIVTDDIITKCSATESTVTRAVKDGYFMYETNKDRSILKPFPTLKNIRALLIGYVLGPISIELTHKIFDLYVKKSGDLLKLYEREKNTDDNVLNSKAKDKSKAKTKSKTKAKAKTKTKDKSKSKTKAKDKSKAKTKSKTKTKTKDKAKTKTKDKSKSKTKTKDKSKSKTKTNDKSKTKAAVKSKSNANSEANAKSKTTAKSKSNTNTKSKDKADSPKIVVCKSIFDILGFDMNVIDSHGGFFKTSKITEDIENEIMELADNCKCAFNVRGWSVFGNKKIKNTAVSLIKSVLRACDYNLEKFKIEKRTNKNVSDGYLITKNKYCNQ